MRIATRLLLTFCAFGVLIAGMLAATSWTTSNQETDGLIINLAGRERMLCQKLAKEILALRVIESRQEDPGELTKAAANSRLIFEMTLNALTHGGKAPVTLDPNGASGELPAAPPNIATQLNDSLTQWKAFIALIETKDSSSAHLRQITAQSNVVVASMTKAVALFQAHAESKVRTSTILQTTGTGLAFVLLFISLFFIRRHLNRPLKALHDYAQELAKGKLDTPLTGHFIQELLELRQSIGTMVESMARMIREAEANESRAAQSAMEALQSSMEATKALERAEKARDEGMREAAETLREMGQNLVRAVAELTGQVDRATLGSTRQEERSENTAQAMEKINQSILDVARNAETANSKASTAREKAAQGAAIVDGVVKAITNVDSRTEHMAEILSRLSGQAEAIGKIMAIISDIADQTNLLALNAAIEAARAGDAGRGFAVVADEVRKLAEKTMTATKEVGMAVQGIQGLTKESGIEMSEAIAAVAQSTDLASKAGTALADIVHIVEETTARIQPIAQASNEQSRASEEITHNMDEVAVIAKETSQGMRHAQQVIASLSSVASRLEAVISEMASGQTKASQHGKLQKDTTQSSSEDFIPWSDELSVGMETIDSQHRKLVKMVNNLHRAIKAHHTQEALGALLIELKDYAVTHFATEEKLFAEFGYPDTKGHVEIHKKLAQKVLDFEAKFLSGQVSIGMELLLFLKDWLVNHIMKVDKRYMGFLQDHGVK